jgi:hypothetical protein
MGGNPSQGNGPFVNNNNVNNNFNRNTNNNINNFQNNRGLNNNGNQINPIPNMAAPPQQPVTHGFNPPPPPPPPNVGPSMYPPQQFPQHG